MAQAKTRGVKKKENTTSSSSKVLKIPQDVLLKEIIELGGTEADLELVQGIESDVENCQESGAAPAKAKGKGAEFKVRTFCKLQVTTATYTRCVSYLRRT